MRKLLNRVLIRFGLLITKAPTILVEKKLPPSKSIAPSLTEKVKLQPAVEKAKNEIFDIFCTETKVHKWHHYFDIYERYLSSFRSHPIRMLEIGVFRGGSLRMWNRYLHPDSIIVGIDIDKACAQHENSNQGIHVRIGSQADLKFLAAVNEEFGPFDIILDDGSHKTHHQIFSFNALFRNALRDGGCYIVEDCHTSYSAKHVDSPETFIEFSKALVDTIHEPYLGREEKAFRLGHMDALQEIELPYLSAHLHSINFHDSIIAFQKKRRALPISELR